MTKIMESPLSRLIGGQPTTENHTKHFPWLGHQFQVDPALAVTFTAIWNGLDLEEEREVFLQGFNVPKPEHRAWATAHVWLPRWVRWLATEVFPTPEVVALCDRWLAGDSPSREEWDAIKWRSEPALGFALAGGVPYALAALYDPQLWLFSRACGAGIWNRLFVAESMEEGVAAAATLQPDKGAFYRAAAAALLEAVK